MEGRRSFFTKDPTRKLFPELGKTNSEGKRVWKIVGDQESRKELSIVESDQPAVEDYHSSSSDYES
ncbi:hypothetical protein KI387_017847, partial [Taxus chinensis]